MKFIKTFCTFIFFLHASTSGVLGMQRYFSYLRQRAPRVQDYIKAPFYSSSRSNYYDEPILYDYNVQPPTFTEWIEFGESQSFPAGKKRLFDSYHSRADKRTFKRFLNLADFILMFARLKLLLIMLNNIKDLVSDSMIQNIEQESKLPGTLSYKISVLIKNSEWPELKELMFKELNDYIKAPIPFSLKPFIEHGVLESDFITIAKESYRLLEIVFTFYALAHHIEKKHTESKIYDQYFKELWLKAISFDPQMIALKDMKDPVAIKSSEMIEQYLSEHSLLDSVKDLRKCRKIIQGLRDEGLLAQFDEHFRHALPEAKIFEEAATIGDLLKKSKGA